MKNKTHILVLGSDETIGKKICETLARNPVWEIYLGGQDFQKATLLASSIQSSHPEVNIYPLKMDWKIDELKKLLEQCKIDILVHVAGPVESQNYQVAQSCIDLKVHYIDIADSRLFVSNFKALDEKAKAQGVVAISGAGVFPGLSSVIVESFYKKFSVLREIEIGIAPSNSLTLTLLDYVGKPFERLEQGKWKTVYGWQNLHSHYYGDNVGIRWHGNYDIPDLTLFPERYPTLTRMVFHAGLEVSFLHILLWHLSWLPRMNLVKNLKFFSRSLRKISHWFDKFGSDKGGMYVRLYGSNHRYQPLELNWTLVAQNGHDIYVPIINCVILAQKIRANLLSPGAQACLGLFTIEEFDSVAASWNIYHTVEEIES